MTVPPSTQPTPDPIMIQGNRTGVLLVHGFNGTLEDLRPLATALADQGWTVHGIWLAGHGTRVEDLATKNYNNWLLSLRRGLIELQKVTDRVVIVGESFGGNLALHAALIGRPIVGVVCLGTPVVFRHDLLNRALLPLLVRLQPFRRKSWVHDPGAHLAKRDYLSVSLQAFREVIAFIDRHTKRELEGVNVPLLIVQAKRDFEVDPDSAHFLFEHAASSRKEVIWVDERVHHVLSSTRRAELTARIISFIRSLQGDV